MENKKQLDNTGWQILVALQEDARLSFVDLGRRVGLSPPAVAERVRRMEADGIITGYRAEVSSKAVGLPITAFVRVQTPSSQYAELVAAVKSMPQMLDCHHLAGTDAFSIRVVAASVEQLEKLIARLSKFGQTTTSIVLSSPVTGVIVTSEAIEPESE